METISNLASSVTTSVTSAIYGTQTNETGGTEPVSGQTGKGTAGDPYDKGNDETIKPSTAAHTQPTTSSTETTTTAPSTESSTTSATKPADDMSSSAPDTEAQKPAGAMSSSVPDTEAQKPTSGENEATESKAGGFGTAEPSVDADPSSGQKPIQKQQGGDKPLDEPTGEQKEAITGEKEEGDDIQHKPSNEQERVEMAEKGELPKDPNDHSGEPMKMHGGSEDKTDKEGEGGETDRKKSVGQEGGQPHGSDKGTGEEWVKTSGFDKDGGDFDATNPGAGREATRLQEEKGIHKDPETGAVTEDSPSTGGPEKVSKIAKLKEKLHLGTGKNLEG